MSEIKLQEWNLGGFWPYTPILSNSVEIGIEMKSVTDWIEATVPGSIYSDLLKAGQIEDPYFETNSLKCEWVANRWWIYKSTFEIGNEYHGQNCQLIFKGIDYKAHIFINNKPIGIHEGMYCHAKFDITDKLDYTEENTITVMLENAPEEMAQIGYTDKTFTQKARFGYKWDFGTRLVNLGLYDDVILSFTGSNRLDNINIISDFLDKKGLIIVNYDIDSCKKNTSKIKVELKYQDIVIYSKESKFTLDDGINSFNEKIIVEEPKLWYPNGYGKQPLYMLYLEVEDENGNADTKISSVGIRKIEYIQNENSDPDSLPYTIVINGKKIYIKGVNLVPLDHLYGCVPDSKYNKTLELIKEGNMNLIRVWGGGLIEKEILYDLCDKHGILIWQEFIQSSSGINNVPSIHPDFMELLKKTAIHAVKEKRNHVSLAVWSGGNELTDKEGVPATFENENIKMLKRIVDELDPTRLMLPTSASGPLEFLDPEKKGKNHDVHGPWKYQGVRDHYTLFNSSDSLLHSEFGVDGLSNLSALKEILSEKNQKVTNMKKNLVWRHHGEWWDTYERDYSIFGKFESLQNFIRCSQFMQAEGLRYSLEANRRRMFQNSGSIVWQFNEPWPNVSCTSIVDYYNTPKLAYYYVAKAFSPIHVSLKYESLVYIKDDEFKGEIYVHNDMEPFEGNVICEIQDENEKCLFKKEWSVIIAENISIQVSNFKWNIINTEKMFYVKLSLRKEKEIYNNSYLFFIKNSDGYCSMPMRTVDCGG